MESPRDKVWIAGDWHANSRWAVGQIQAARAIGCDRVLQLGDFGVWRQHQGFLDEVEAACVEHNIMLYFVDGNHEDFEFLYSLPEGDDGLREVRPHIVHIPRGKQWMWSGVKFAGLGGAYSIDRKYRTLGKTWFMEELVNDEEKRRAMEQQSVDVYVTHDAAPSIPMRMLPIEASTAHRQLVGDVAKALKPRLWLHGHMHHPVKYSYRTGDESTTVVGLDCDGMTHSYAILDLSNRTLEFPTDTFYDVFGTPVRFW